MRGKIAQLAGFIDQAGLFLARRAVTNKLHFIAPSGVFFTWDASWNSGRGNSTAEASRIAGLFIRRVFVGWAKRSVPTIQEHPCRWWARRKCAFAHPTIPAHPNAIN